MDLNSCHISLDPLEKHWTCNSTSHWATIQKVMGRPSEPIRCWNSTSKCIVTINKTIGRVYFLLQNSLTIMPLALHRNLTLLCEQRLPSKHFCASRTWVGIQKGMWFCHQPGWTPHHTERTDQNSPIMLPVLGWCTLGPCPQFPIGSHAFVKAQFFHTTQPSKKLTEKYLGPFEVIAQVGSHSFTLHLPDSMQAIHPVFHISMLEPTHGNTILERIQSPLPLIKINGKPEYEIYKILDSKIDKCWKHCNTIYLVQWTGYKGTDEEISWILANESGHASKIVADFHKAYPGKPGPWTS